MITLPSASSGTTHTAPVWRTMSRSKVYPDGSRNVPVTRRMNEPSYRVRSPRNRNDPRSCDGIGPDLEQVRIALTRAGEGGADELAKERVRTVRPALELRVRLGSNPERVLGELDELDEPLVGREPRATEPSIFEALPEAVVHLVA